MERNFAQKFTANKKWYTLLAIVLCVFLYVAFAADSCSGGSSPVQNQITNQVDNQDTIYNKNQPIPTYDYSPEKDALTQIYNYRMQNVDTWTVVIPMNPLVQPYVTPSKGYPIPYTTQLTNPMRELDAGYQQGWAVTIPQSEPNGLYTGTTMATWFLAVRTLPGGGSETVPIYSEPDVMAFPFPVEFKNGQIVDIGQQSSIQITGLHAGKPTKATPTPSS